MPDTSIFRIPKPWLRRQCRRLLAALLVLCAATASFAQQTDDPVQQVLQARALASKQLYRQALDLTNAVLPKIIGQYGEAHIYHAYVLDDLSRYNSLLGMGRQAVDYSEKALLILEGVANHAAADRLNFLHNKATALSVSGAPTEAVQLYEAVLKGRREIGDADGQLSVLRALGDAAMDSRRFDLSIRYLGDAESLARDRGPEAWVPVRLDLARAYYLNDRLDDASQLLASLETEAVAGEGQVAVDRQLLKAQIAIEQSDFQTALALLGQLGNDESVSSASRAEMHYSRGSIAILNGDALTARREFELALRHYANVVDESHSSVLRARHGLAIAYGQMGRHDIATDIFEDVLSQLETSYGQDHLVVAETLTELSRSFLSAEKPELALQTARRAQRIYRDDANASDWHRGIASSAAGFALAESGETRQAMAHLEGALNAIETVRGPMSADLVPGLLRLAELLVGTGDYATVSKRLEHARRIIDLQPVQTIEKYSELERIESTMALAQGDCIGVLEHARSGLSAATDYILGYVGNLDQTSSITADRRVIEGIVDNLAACVSAGSLGTRDSAALHALIFSAMQLPSLRSTASAVSQLNIVDQIDSRELSEWVEQRRLRITEIRKINSRIQSELKTGGQTTAYRQLLRDRQAGLGQLADIEQRIDQAFPEFGELIQPRPVDLREIQAALNPGEALLKILLGKSQAVIALVGHDSVRYSVSSDANARRTAERVESIRSGLDVEQFTSRTDFPGFDTRSAYLLYEQLLQPFTRELSAIDHVIVVADGSLQRLPFSLLLDALPASSPGRLSDFAKLAYLNRRFSFSYLPSVGSLPVLRNLAVDSADSTATFIGFGDPVMLQTGSGGELESMLERGGYEGAGPFDLSAYFTRLPDSATELEQIMSLLDSDRSALYLAEKATKQTVLDTDFSDVDLLAFATHGVMADELSAFREPGLLLSQSDSQDDFSDVLLSASEIAGMDLDVDWVLLSACNTAAPESAESGVEGLSGLARSFFFAGARALLVSHWYVETKSASVLTTRTIEKYFDASRAAPVSKSKALQAVMNSFIDGEFGRDYSHPAFWSPFVVVGES